MANIYCLCESEITPPNILGEVKVILPDYPVRCIKTGATTFLRGGYIHYPNVDIFECPNCKMKVAR